MFKSLTAAAVLGLIASTASANLIVNGDFQTGALGPSTTTYTFNSVDMQPPATWNIVSFNTIHSSWVDFYDHTFGDERGRYMIVNGTDAGLGPAWAQAVALTANTDYELSAWFATLFPQSPAALQFRIVGANGTLTSGTFFAPMATGTWAQTTYSFNSGNETNVSIEIWDINDQFTGNDYAIDDISLNAVPTPGAAALLGIGGLLAGRRRRR